MSKQYTEEECIEALKRASEKLDKVSEPKYQQLDFSPSSSTIRKRFGSWNEAKEAADLELSMKGNPSVSNINRSFFKQIDEPQKAYWLGFLYGDGCISKNRVGNWRLSIGVKNQDRHHLEKFKEDTEARVNVGHGKIAQLEISDKKLVEDLRNLGCDENKTHNENLPSLESHELRGHFVRGLIDADGHVDSYHDHYRIELIQSKESERLKELKNWIPYHTNLRSRKSSKLMSIGCKDDIENVLDWIYPEGEITEPALDRKKNQLFN